MENHPLHIAGEAGIICRSGMNSAGLGDGVNTGTTNAPVNFEGVPLQFLLRGFWIPII